MHYDSYINSIEKGGTQVKGIWETLGNIGTFLTGLAALIVAITTLRKHR